MNKGLRFQPHVPPALASTYSLCWLILYVLCYLVTHTQECSEVTPGNAQGISVLPLYSDPNSVGDDNDFNLFAFCLSCKDMKGSSWEHWPTLHHLGCAPTPESNLVIKLMAIHGLSDMDIGWGGEPNMAHVVLTSGRGAREGNEGYCKLRTAVRL